METEKEKQLHLSLHNHFSNSKESNFHCKSVCWWCGLHIFLSRSYAHILCLPEVRITNNGLLVQYSCKKANLRGSAEHRMHYLLYPCGSKSLSYLGWHQCVSGTKSSRKRFLNISRGAVFRPLLQTEALTRLDDQLGASPEGEPLSTSSIHTLKQALTETSCQKIRPCASENLHSFSETHSHQRRCCSSALCYWSLLPLS